MTKHYTKDEIWERRIADGRLNQELYGLGLLLAAIRVLDGTYRGLVTREVESAVEVLRKGLDFQVIT